MPVLRDLFIALSEVKTFNDASKTMGLRFGAQKVVGGITTEDAVKKIKELNRDGMSVTFDNLGEFITERSEAETEKNKIIEMIRASDKAGIDAHLSVKLTQIGLNIDYDFALKNIREVMEAAKEANMFVNLDMESYPKKIETMEILDELLKEYDNVGTVIQAYLFDSPEDVLKYKDVRLRIVKGAYKEPGNIAYQSKEDIDRSFFELIKTHLTNGTGFTSIATHDHNIINKVKAFVKENNISKDKFEFQMLYGFRTDYQKELVKEGYNFCVYLPYGPDWYAYFMRRIAERPQNINLVVKSVTTNKKFQYGAGAALALLGALFVTKRNK